MAQVINQVFFEGVVSKSTEGEKGGKFCVEQNDGKSQYSTRAYVMCKNEMLPYDGDTVLVIGKWSSGKNGAFVYAFSVAVKAPAGAPQTQAPTPPTPPARGRTPQAPAAPAPTPPDDDIPF